MMAGFRNNPKVNQIRFGIVLVFVVFLAYNYVDGIIKRHQTKVNEIQQVKVEKQKKQIKIFSKKLETTKEIMRVVKVKNDIETFDSPKGALKGRITRGSEVTILESAYNRRWFLVEFGEKYQKGWVKSLNLSF